jgi:hypothetical protein
MRLGNRQRNIEALCDGIVTKRVFVDAGIKISHALS